MLLASELESITLPDGTSPDDTRTRSRRAWRVRYLRGPQSAGILLKTLFKRSAFPLSLRGTYAAILLLKQFSSKLDGD